MNYMNKTVTESEFYILIQKIIGMIDHTMTNNEEFQDIIRFLPQNYFSTWVSGTKYIVGDIFVEKGLKYIVIKDYTDDVVNNEPYLATMRDYSLPYQGAWANLWAFKEPVSRGCLRFPYGSTDIYESKANIPSDLNTVPPNENLDYWRLATEPEEEENK